MEAFDYEGNANKLLEEMGIEFSAEFLRNGHHFDDDRDTRDIYKLTLKRKATGRAFSVEFGQSMSKSRPTKEELRDIFSRHGRSAEQKRIKQVRPPRAYDLLACLTKCCPGTFAEFCSEFEYDTDSISAHKTWKAVVEEWFEVERFFSSDELEKIREIA